mgnify:CR=1 FL=1
MKELRTLSRIDLTPGDHPVDIYEGQETTNPLVAERTVTAASGASLAFAVHPDEAGAETTSVFDDDLSKTGSATTRLEVRHVAQAGPVEIEISPASSSATGSNESFVIANGEQGVISGVDASVDYQLTVTPEGGTSPLITDTQVQLSPGRIVTIYVAGNPPSGESASDPESLLEATRDVGALPPPKVNLVNGFTTESFVFYVDGTQNASIEGLRRNGGLQGLGEGEVTVDAYRASGTPGEGTPSASLAITVCDGRSYDLAVYQDATNSTQLTLFENDVTAPAASRTRFTIRHIGARNALDFVFDGSGDHITRQAFPVGPAAGVGDRFVDEWTEGLDAVGDTVGDDLGERILDLLERVGVDLLAVGVIDLDVLEVRDRSVETESFGQFGERIAVVTVDPSCTQLDGDSESRVGVNSTAETVATLDHRHLDVLVDQTLRRSESGGAGADHDDGDVGAELSHDRVGGFEPGQQCAVNRRGIVDRGRFACEVEPVVDGRTERRSIRQGGPCGEIAVTPARERILSPTRDDRSTRLRIVSGPGFGALAVVLIHTEIEFVVDNAG